MAPAPDKNSYVYLRNPRYEFITKTTLRLFHMQPPALA